MTNPAIAIVGLGCRYPDAVLPSELWENVLAQRRAFRRMPEERLSRGYYSPDPHAPDKTYAMTAAVIEDYEFDRIRHRVSECSDADLQLAPTFHERALVTTNDEFRVVAPIGLDEIVAPTDVVANLEIKQRH